jgi:hypothetical protein
MGMMGSIKARRNPAEVDLLWCVGGLGVFKLEVLGQRTGMPQPARRPHGYFSVAAGIADIIHHGSGGVRGVISHLFDLRL